MERALVSSGGTAKAASGQPPFHPKMMVALLLYAYANGTPSSRRIARLCERDVGYRVVSANQQPDFRTISEFRRTHLKALEDAAREKAPARGRPPAGAVPGKLSGEWSLWCTTHNLLKMWAAQA